MTNSYITKFQLGGIEYSIKDKLVRDEISYITHYINDYSAYVTNELASLEDFAASITEFIDCSYIQTIANDNNEQEFTLNLHII